MAATPGKRPSWKLAAPNDVQTQGIVVSGFSALPAAKALFLCCGWSENGPDMVAVRGKGAWLKALNAVAPITDCDGKDPRAATIAFTWTGLQKSGLYPEALATFSTPFREGMYQEDRLRRLGDKYEDKWLESVIDGGPLWSANTPALDPAKVLAATRGFDDPGSPEQLPPPRQVITPKTVHALLMLYDTDKTAVDEWATAVKAALAPFDVQAVRELDLCLEVDANDVGREHFGFADGISQPLPFDAQNATGNPPGDDRTDDRTVVLDGKPAPRDPWHGVPLGEILLGHTNAHAEKSPGPLVPDEQLARTAELPQDGAPEGYLNFGLNGSYMVVRELRQYVARFWQNLEDNAAKIRAHDPLATHVTAEWLAERIVGRSVDGHMLCPAGHLPADANNGPENSFGFAGTDLHGHGCPMGSHVRRSNPRDGLAPDPASGPTLLSAANNHRILRRGRKFGSSPADLRKDDGEERGLLFVCLNSDIARQFEFIQQTWLLNENFATLYDETDPLVGPKGGFTIPEQPLRRIVDVQTFIQMAGGDYFFLPSLPAVNYLASL
jgi:deferrochelatase/peroxidase EfeB